MKEASPPVSAMATPTNSSGNLVDEFEEAFQVRHHCKPTLSDIFMVHLFQHCLDVLTKEEAVSTTDKDDVRVEVEQTTLRFIDLARQMEAFFLQKRFLLSALKPETVVKEDINELRLELARKEELLKRHYDKIAVWQNLLADLQVYAKSPAQGGSTPGIINNGSGAVPSPMGAMSAGQSSSPMVAPGMPSAMQMQQIQQQQQLQQMQQQQMQLQQQMQVDRR